MGGDVFRDEYSLAFDGTNDYIIIPDAAALSFDAFSSAGWIKLGDATNCPIITKGIYNTSAEYAIKLQSDDKLHFWVADESVSSCHIGRASPVLTSYEGQWIHFACTYDGGTASSGLKIYINGSQVDDANDEGNAGSFVAMEDLAADVHIVRYGSTYGELSISDLAIYNEELTQGEVLNVYNGREPYNHMEGPVAGKLSGWWRMGDGDLDGFSRTTASELTDSGYGIVQDMVSPTIAAPSISWINRDFDTCTIDGLDITSCISDGSGAHDFSSDGFGVTAGDLFEISFTIAGSLIPSNDKLLFRLSPVSGLGSEVFECKINAAGDYHFFAAFTATDGSSHMGIRASSEACNFSMTNFKCIKYEGNPGKLVNMTADDFEGDTP